MKKILSFILALSMLTIPVTAFADVTAVDRVDKEYTNSIADKLLAESATLDTSVFEGAPGYIMQEIFSNVNGVDKLGMPSGWDVDKRGGSISSSENVKTQIVDSSDKYSVSMTREILAHKSGKITFETAFKMEGKTETGYSYALTGNGKSVFKIVTENDKLAILSTDGKTKQVASYKPNEIVRIKAILDFDTKTYELVVGGKLIGKFPFAEDATQLDRVTVSTSDAEKMQIWIRYIYIYFNYVVNETFMQTSEGAVPYDWEITGGGSSSTVMYDPNQV